MGGWVGAIDRRCGGGSLALHVQMGYAEYAIEMIDSM